MGPGGDGGPRGVRLIDGFDGFPDLDEPAAQQPGAAGQGQDAERKRVLDSLRGPNPMGGANDGFGSFQPIPKTPPADKPDKSNAFFVAIKWFTDGIIETVRETFSLLGLFKPVETFEISRATYFDEEITALDDETLNEGVPADEAVDTIELGAIETFVPEVMDLSVFYESAYCAL